MQRYIVSGYMEKNVPGDTAVQFIYTNFNTRLFHTFLKGG